MVLYPFGALEAVSPILPNGSANQKPKPSEPAATFPLKVLRGLVIQNVAGFSVSAGITVLPGLGARVSIPRFSINLFSTSAPSSRKNA